MGRALPTRVPAGAPWPRSSAATDSSLTSPVQGAGRCWERAPMPALEKPPSALPDPEHSDSPLPELGRKEAAGGSLPGRLGWPRRVSPSRRRHLCLQGLPPLVTVGEGGVLRRGAFWKVGAAAPHRGCVDQGSPLQGTYMEKPQTVAKDNRFYENAGVKAVLAIPNVKGRKRRTDFRRYFVSGKNADPHPPAPTHPCKPAHTHGHREPVRPRSDAHHFRAVTRSSAAPSRASHEDMAQAEDTLSGWHSSLNTTVCKSASEERRGQGSSGGGGPRITVWPPNARQADSGHVGLPFHWCRGVQTTPRGSTGARWEPNSRQQEAASPHPGSCPLGQRWPCAGPGGWGHGTISGPSSLLGSDGHCLPPGYLTLWLPTPVHPLPRGSSLGP